MAKSKKLVAITNVKHNDMFFDAGDEIDPAIFSKAELRVLYDNGAVEVREVDVQEPEEEKAPEPEEVPQTEGPDTTVKAP